VRKREGGSKEEAVKNGREQFGFRFFFSATHGQRGRKKKSRWLDRLAKGKLGERITRRSVGGPA